MPVYESTKAPEGYTGNAPKTYALMPEDLILEATVLEVKDDVKPFNKKVDGVDTGEPMVKVAFTFGTNFDDQDRKVWGEVYPEFYHHPDCQLHAWAQEILGADLPGDFRLNTDDLVGLPVRVLMGQRSYTQKSTGERKTVNYVKDLLRSNSAGGTVPAAAPAASAGYEDPF